MNLATFIAWRYLRSKDKDRNISFMLKVCFLGIFIGTFSLMVTLIVMNGFEKVIHEKMQGINAQVIISSPGNKLDYDELRPMLQAYGSDLFTGVSGYSLKQAILNKNNEQTVLVVKGIDPAYEGMVTALPDKLIRHAQEDMPHLQALLHDNGILIGHKTAEAHNLAVGDEVTLMIPEPGGKKKIVLDKQRFVVQGIFNIGLEEYDSNFVFMSLDLLHQLYDEDGVDVVTLAINEQVAARTMKGLSKLMYYMKFWQRSEYVERRVVSELQRGLPHLHVQTWKELYPALVSSLKLEKYAMFLIIMLISLVASLNMISLLFMQIQQKQHDVAILKAMGLASHVIRNIFLSIGMTVTVIAATCGLSAAALVGYVLETYPFIELPDVYYVSHLPARMDAGLFMLVFMVTMLIGFFATWYPAQRSKKLLIAEVLRQG